MLRQFTAKRIIMVLILTLSLVWLTVYSFPDNKLHVVFCDVGQGDAALISKGFNQILIDGGPNDKVLDCLAKNMPFYDRTIEVVALTHPEADHMTGIISVLEKYKVQYFLSGPEGNESAGYAALISKIKNQKSKPNLKTQNSGVKIVNPYTGTKIKIGDIVMESLWPSREWVAENIENGMWEVRNEKLDNEYVDRKLEVGSGKIGKSNFSPLTSISSLPPPTSHFILGAKATDSHLNDFSLVFLLTYDNNLSYLRQKTVNNTNAKQILFMGDADIRVQDEMINENFKFQISNFKLDILKFPHHGSKTGTSVDFLEKIKPKEAVISVGKNSYGHPTTEALDLLRSLNVKIRRTDIEGEIKYTF